MRAQRWSGTVLGRVNPLVPAAVVLVGLGVYLAGLPWVGSGIVVGSLLAFVNSLILSRRVEMAADAGDFARAILIMQLSLLVSATFIAIVVVVLIHFSLAMAVASAAGFAATHLGILAVFYWTRARVRAALEGELS